MGDDDVTGRGFAASVAECEARGCCIQSATWPGDHKMPPMGESVYEAMRRYLFPEPDVEPVQQKEQAVPTPAKDDGDDDDDLAALGF